MSSIYFRKQHFYKYNNMMHRKPQLWTKKIYMKYYGKNFQKIAIALAASYELTSFFMLKYAMM